MEDKKHTHGFKTPEKYFENFEEQLFNKMEEKTFPKEAGFKVPDGYFESLEEYVLQQLDVSKKKTKVIPLFQRKVLLYAAGIAASAAILFSVFNNKNVASIDLNTLQFSNIENYIEEGNLTLDSYDVIALLSDEEVSNLSFENEFFSEENLEDYLLENMDDTALLLE